jgi:two-component system, sensor histidine kinase and response regulator
VDEIGLKVLLVEDNPADAFVLQRLLTPTGHLPQFHILWVKCLEDALQALNNDTFNAILLDLGLPDSQGLETVRQVYEIAPKIPIVVLTGLDDEEIAVDTLRQGAQDYLVKGEIHRPWMVRAIHYAIERQQIVEQLQKLNDELARSNHELEQFAYIASHDLQQPLMSIGAFAQLITMKSQGHLDPKVDRYLTQILQAVTRMQQLIQDLLVYSRIGMGDRPTEPTDCNRILAEALEGLQGSIAESGAIIRADPLPTVRADPAQLLQLFSNLLGNAIKYHRPDEPPQIYIVVKPQRHEWCFEMRDNGIGIESEYFDRVFQIFQRLHSASTYPGTGIGLAICKKIVESYGGRIWVESTFDSGSSFFFTLPRGDR